MHGAFWTAVQIPVNQIHSSNLAFQRYCVHLLCLGHVFTIIIYALRARSMSVEIQWALRPYRGSTAKTASIKSSFGHSEKKYRLGQHDILRNKLLDSSRGYLLALNNDTVFIN